MAERAGCPIIISLWSYVIENVLKAIYIAARSQLHIGQLENEE